MTQYILGVLTGGAFTFSILLWLHNHEEIRAKLRNKWQNLTRNFGEERVPYEAPREHFPKVFDTKGKWINVN